MTQAPFKENMIDWHAIIQSSDCLFNQNDLNLALDRMASEMTLCLKDRQPLILCVMQGGLIACGHLLTRLLFPLEMDYVHLTRYGHAFEGSTLNWIASPKQSLKGRCVVIVDDIMDEGITLSAIREHCLKEGASEVYIAVMVYKNRMRPSFVDFKPDFFGVQAPDRFLFGFGLDYQGYFRNLHALYAVSEDHSSCK